MKPSSWYRPIATSLLLAGLSACTLAPAYQQPVVNIPAQFRYDTGAQGLQASQMGWADYFADPRLKALIELALRNNPDLRVAALNAEGVRAQYAITRAASLPSINATGTQTRARVAADLSSTRQSYITNSYSVGAGISSYEIDLFGKARSNNQVALQSYFSSAAARDAAQLSLITSVAKAYFNELYAQESMNLAQKVLQSRQETYRLAQLRHDAGVISAIDLESVRGLIETAKADYAAAEQARDTAQNALAVLINQSIPAQLPQGLPLSAQFVHKDLLAGLSADVLHNRPDILQAEYNLRKANADIGAARAAFFPSISLTSTIGSGSTELSRLFTGPNQTWSFIPTINIPIFNWGALKASLDYRKIQQNIAVANYEKAVQSAFQDVANALSARAHYQTRLEANQAQQAAYAHSLSLIRLRYRHGVSSALDLLEAERNSYSADAMLLSTRLNAMSNLADLYAALGGGLKQYSSPLETSAPSSVSVVK